MAGSSGYSVGRVYVSIVPDAARFASDLAAQVVPAADRAGKAAGDRIGEQIRKAIVAAVNAGLVAGGAGAGGAGAKAGSAYGGEFDRVVRSKIEAALRTIPPVNLNVATSEAEQKLRDIRIELETLVGQRIGVDIDDEAAIDKVRELRLRLIELAANSPNIQVQTDTEAAILHLDEVLLKVDELGARSPTIKPDVDTAGAEAKLAELDFASMAAGGGFSGLITAGLALGPALIPVIAAVTAAVVGLGATLASIGIAGGVLALGFSGVKTAMQELTQEQTKQAASSGRSASAAASQAAAQVSAAAQLKQAEASLANTRANAAEAARKAAQAVVRAKAAEVQAEQDAHAKIVDAERKVSDAREAYTAAVQQAADHVSSAQDTLATAERNLADAQRSATDAQNALVEARKTAQQQLEDLTNQVTDNDLAVRQAQLSLNGAQDNLANTNASPLSTADQKAQAQLDYETALQRLHELQQQQQRLADEKAAADKAGVEGSAVVVAAQDAIAQAQQRVIDAQDAQRKASAAVVQAQIDGVKAVRDAQAGIAEAVAGVAKAQQEGAAAVIKAQQAVTDAIQAQADQQRQSAFSVAQAVAQVAAAQRAVAQAAQGAQSSGAGAIDAIKDKLAKLDPATLAFAKFLLSLRPEFEKLRGAAAGGLLPGVEAGIKTLLPLLPALDGFVGRVATGLGKLFAEGAKALTNPAWQRFFGYLGSSALPIFDTFARILGNLLLGFGGIVRGFAPLTSALGGGLLSLSRRFAAFGDAAGSGKSSGFNSFLAYIKANAPLVIQTFKDIGAVIGHLVEGLAGSGVSILKFVDSVAKFLASLDPSTLALIYKSVTAVALALKAFSIITPIIKAVGLAIEFLGGALRILFTAVMANPVVAIIVAIIAALVILYVKWGAFRDIVNEVWAAVSAAVLTAWTDYILPTLKAIGDWLTNTLAPAIQDFYNNVIVPTWSAISAAIHTAWTDYIRPTLKAIGDWVVNTLAPAIRNFYNNVVVPIFKAIGTVIKTVWLDVIAPALNDFWLFIKDVLAPIVQFLYNTIVKPIFQAIGTTVADVWNKDIYPALHSFWDYLKNTVGPEISKLWDTYARPAFKALGDAATDLWNKVLKPAFQGIGDVIEGAWKNVIKPALDSVHTALDAIGDAFRNFRTTAANVWYDVESFFVNGVNKVIDVINSLTHALSSIPGVPIHITPIGHVGAPTRPPDGTGTGGSGPNRPFSLGGIVPGGYSFRDTVSAMLSPGEGVLVPEVVAALGPDFVHYLNHTFSGGRAGSSSTGRGYSFGGIVDGIKSGVTSIVGAPVNAAISAAEDAAHALASRLIPDNLFRAMANGFISKVGDAFKFDNGGWLMPGGIGVNLSGQPEPVFNADQWATLKSAIGSGLGRLDPSQISTPRPGHTFHTEVHNNGQPITAAAVVEAQNRNLTMHDLPQLIGLGV